MGLGPDASAEEIKHKYRELVKQHHPDRNTAGPDSEEKLKEIIEAYHVLGNAERKSAYDHLQYISLKNESDWDARRFFDDIDIILRFSGGGVRPSSGRKSCGKGFAKGKKCRRWR